MGSQFFIVYDSHEDIWSASKKRTNVKQIKTFEEKQDHTKYLTHLHITTEYSVVKEEEREI